VFNGERTVYVVKQEIIITQRELPKWRKLRNINVRYRRDKKVVWL
jgi:hypothetical protein